MSCPPIWKWRPRLFFHCVRRMGWDLAFYQHTDHNPVILIGRWNGQWLFQFYHDYFYERRLFKKYGKF